MSPFPLLFLSLPHITFTVGRQGGQGIERTELRVISPGWNGLDLDWSGTGMASMFFCVLSFLSYYYCSSSPSLSPRAPRFPFVSLSSRPPSPRCMEVCVVNTQLDGARLYE